MADPPIHEERPSEPGVMRTTTEQSALTREDLISAVGASPNPPKTGATSHPGYDATSIVDLGWHEDPENISPLVDGISNEDVFTLIRRFNKVVWYLKDGSSVPPGGLDLVVSPDQEFAPNKMRAQVERFYISVIVRVLAIVKHIARLRSWNEKKRTGALCLLYFALWFVDLLTFGLLIVAIALIVSPPVRKALFPTAPIALVDSITGGVTKPNSGILGSHDSITGAPENMPGEAVESEAANFVTTFAGIGTNLMTGNDPAGEPNPPEQAMQSPLKATPDELTTMVASAKDKAEGINEPSQDKTKVPMGTILWSKVRPAMHQLTCICDFVERFANALSPKSPCHPNAHRLRFASVLAPLAAVSPFLSRDLAIRSAQLLFGVLFFGKPALQTGMDWLNQRYPSWSEWTDINHYLLHGVPTNPQLALILLREGEEKKTPLPPPPRIREAPSHTSLTLDETMIDATGDDQPLGASEAELAEAAAPDHDALDDAGGDDVEVSKSEGSKEPHKLLRIIKGAAKTGVKAAVTFDKVRAKLGHDGAKNRAGAVPSKRENVINGPYEFNARYLGEKGFLYIDTSAALPFLAFNKTSTTAIGGVTPDPIRLEPVWTMPISEIKEIRKHSGYGFKSKLAAGWLLDEEISDAIGIQDRRGNKFAITAITQRDAVFNRLIAIGTQKWEVW